MPKTPFGGGNGGLQPTVSLMGQIGQSSSTTPDTRGIGTLSLDFSGQQKRQENNLKAEGLGAVPGVIADAVTGGVGAVVGGILSAASIPANTVFSELRKGALQKYMGDEPGPVSDALTMLGRFAFPDQTTAGKKQEEQFKEFFRKSVPLPDFVKDPLYAASMDFPGIGLRNIAKIPFAAGGVALSRQKIVGAIGGQAFLPQMVSNDPETLPTEVKSILDNGGTMEDALNYMKTNYKWIGDDDITNFLVGLTIDPIMWLGYPISFSSKIGASQQLADIAGSGKTWQEFLLQSTLNPMELKVAKRMGFLGKTYNSTLGRGWDRVKEIARATVVDSTMKMIDAKIINEADEVAREIGGTAPKLLANNLNRSINFMLVDASKSPLTRNAASGAREWAESVIDTASKGKDALRKMPEFLGAGDDVLDDIVNKVKDYNESYSDEALDKLNTLLDGLRQGRNIKLINDEVGGFFMKGVKRIPYVGKYYRGEMIYAARRSLNRSLQRHENDIVRAFESGNPSDFERIRSKYVAKMGSSLDTTANGGTEILNRYFGKKFTQSQAKWAIGKKEEAVREMARVMEVSQMNGFAQAIRIVQPLRKLTGLKITPVLDNRFSKESLETSIDTLEKAIASGDKSIVSQVVNNLVIQYQDLSFKFDSMNFAKNLADDPMNFGDEILKHMKRLYREEAYVTRLPNDMLGKMDEFEFGIAPSAAMGSQGASRSILSRVFSNSKFGAADVKSLDDINQPLSGEVTKTVLTEAVQRGEDISSWNNLARFEIAQDGSQAMPSQEFALRLINEAIDKITFESKTGTMLPAATPKSNMWLQRNMSENFHTGVRVLEGVTTEAKHYFNAPLIQTRTLTDMFDAVSTRIDSGQLPAWAGSAKIDDLLPDENYLARLYDAPGSVVGYDGIYLTNDSYGANIIQKAAALPGGVKPEAVTLELIRNRLALSMFEDPQYTGVWRASNIMLEKKNPGKMIDKVFGQPFTADFGSPLLDNTFVGLNAVFNAGVDKVSKILGKAEDGVKQVKALSAKDKEKVFLDPRRIILGYMTENTPVRSVPDLERTIFRFSTTADKPNTVDSVYEMIGDLRLPVSGMWNPTLDLKEWIKMYLTGVVDGGNTRVIDVLMDGERSDMVVMRQYTQDELDMFAKTGIDTTIPTPDIDATAAKIMDETDGIGSYLYLAANHADKLRNVDIKPGSIVSTDILAWRKMSPINEDGAQKFAFSDLFHYIDNLNDPVNRNMANQMSKDSLGEKFAETLYDSYYEFGPQGIRPFDFLSYNNIPHSSGAILKGQAKNEFNNVLAQQVLDGKMTPVEALQTAAREAMVMDVEDFADLTVVKTFGYESGRLHRMVDRFGIFAESRLGAFYKKPARSMRVYDPSGSPMLETRYVQPWKEGSPITGVPVLDDTSVSFTERFAYPDGFDTQALRMIQNDVQFDATSAAAKAAVQAEEITVDTTQPKTPEEAAAEILDPGAAARRAAEEKATKEAAEKAAIEQLVNARATLREIGYEMGLEPKQPYIQSLDVMRDVAGNAVIRPRYDIYTSIDEVEDLSAFGMKDENVLPMRGKGPFNKIKQWTIPISNNEIYDSGVERLRYYLGNRISQEDSLRLMANIAEHSMKMEINPGGLGNEKLAEIIIDVLGGGEKGLRAYNRAFGIGGANASPRAALMYALQGRPEIIGWTTNLSKRLQAKSETMAMIAQKIYPLTRYRYNPYFNWQEGIEPYAFNILRGVRGQKQYEDGSMMARLLSMKGGAMLDYHNVGAHVILRNTSLLQRISNPNPGLDIAVGSRAIDRLTRAGAEGLGVLGGASEKFKQSISNAKEVSFTAGTFNEAVRTAAPSIISDQPEVGLNWLEITGSIDPATNFRYFMDQNINGMLPTQIVRIADVASAPHTFGAPINPSFLQPFEDVAALDNITKDQIENLEDISAVLEKVGGPIELRKKLAYAARKYLASVKTTISNGSAIITSGRYYKGQPAITTIDGISREAESQIRAYTQNFYENVSRYLGAKAQYGIQLNSKKQNLTRMTEIADRVGGLDDMDRAVSLLDSAILNNRILNRGRIYRGFDFKVIVNESDIPNLKPGFRFGDESFLSWSKAESEARTSPGIEQSGPNAHKTILIIDDAKGLPGIDLNAVGSSVPREEEVLLPRGMEFEIVEVLPPQPGTRHINYYKVKPLLPPQAVEVMSRTVPNDAARLELQNAIADIKIQQAKNVETYNDLARLFKAYPDLLEGVRSMGMKLGLEPAEQASVRYRRTRRKPSVSPAKVDNFDPRAMHDRYSTQLGEYTQPQQPAYLDPTTVFGWKKQGPLASLNIGGKTGVWVGNDGVHRYVKTIREYDPSAGQDTFHDPHSIVNEFIVNRLLKKMGVAVPEVSLVNDGDTVYLASQWVEGMKDLERVPITNDIARAVADNHVADLIVANFDALGPDLKNMGIMPDGTIVRTDVGNSTFYRAGGGLKQNKSLGTVDPRLWEDVDPSFWWNPELQSTLGANRKYKEMLEQAYPELRTKGSTLEIPNFIEQYTDMITRLGKVSDAIDEIAESIRPFIDQLPDQSWYRDTNKNLQPITGAGVIPSFNARISFTKALLEKRINQIDAAVDRIRQQRVAEWDAQMAVTKPARRPTIRKQDKWLVDLSERMAAAQGEGIRLPGLDLAISTVKAGGKLSPEQVNAISNGLAPFLYKRGAMKQFIDSIAQMNAVASQRVFREQMYSTYKGALERTLNHPFMGPYPVSYMYGKVLPAFFDALFKYAPFTSEFAPFSGVYRLDKFADYIATELETNDELYEYVMKRPPLLMFLSGLLPGWPTDIGASLPYWFREGIMRPVAEGNFEDIPGKLAESTVTTLTRQFGPAQSALRTKDAITDIQSFLTGDPQTSVIDDISEFLSIKDSN